MTQQEYKYLMYDQHQRLPNKEQAYRRSARIKSSWQSMVRKAEQINKRASVTVRWAV